MTSNYAIAAQCQLKRDDVLELLALANSPTLADGTEPLPPWRLLLTAAHVRALMVRALIRLSIPKNKQQTLIRNNPYVQAESAHTRVGAAGGEGQSTTYRVGRIVALVLRPGATPGGADSHALLSDWMIAVHFGEATELLAAKYLSNDDFTVAEHAVYVRSCIAPRPAAAAELMPAEEADTVMRNVQDIKQFVAATNTGAGAGRKRPREETTQLNVIAQHGADHGRNTATTNSHNNTTDNNAEEEEEEAKDESAKGGVVPRSELLAERLEWETSRAEQHLHLAALRQLLNSKNSEMQRVLQSQRQAEAAHATALEQWRGKMAEQGQAIQRAETALAEERAAQREHKEKSDRLVEQLKRLAEQTRRFKAVSDAVAEWLRTASRQPEEVLAKLKEHIATHGAS